MKNNKLPNKKEWNNIINEAFSSDSEHRFSERYIQKKEKIKGGLIMKKLTFKPEKLFIRLTTAAVLAAVAIPTAAVTLNHMNRSDAPAAAQISTEAGTESAENTTIAATAAEPETNVTPSENQHQSVSTAPMAISLGVIPNGFYMDKIEFPAYEDQNVTTQEEYELQTLVFYNGSGAIYADLYTIPENYEFTTNDYAPNIKNPDKTETFRIDNKTVYLIRSLEPYYHTMITAFVRFDNSDYVAVVNANKTDCEDDVKEFIKSLFLTPAEPDTVMKTLTLPWANNGNANTKELPENGCPLGND